MNTEMTPFRARFPQSDLDDLQQRLARTRWPEAETVDDWSQGVPLAWLRDLCAYWGEHYDWRAAEARLNGLPQFRTEIDGLGIHFLHVRSPHPEAMPLLISHGWPGSVIEFLDIIEPLTHPADPADAFHVVCPSLPGFAFSDKPTGTGWTVERTAAAWAELMARLGYQRYAAHGVDWGSFLTGVLGETDGEHLAGIHLAMPFALPPQEKVELDERDLAGLAALKEFQQNEGAYSAVQATRPQTLGYGLTDSPVGQLAWMAEKYWAWSDHDGDLEKCIPRDRLLDAVTLAWFSATGASSGRIYWESHNRMAFAQVDVPTACSAFPKDARMPRAWCERRFTDLRRWTDHESGGHFPALEQPAVLVDELRSFFRSLRVRTPEEAPGFPLPGSSYRGPGPAFARLRAERPVARVAMAGGGHAWLVTRHADIRRVLDDPRFSRAAMYEPSAPRFDGLFQAPPGMIISLDPPNHTRLRAFASRAFSTDRIGSMRPRVRELVTGLLNELGTTSPVDLMDRFASPLAMTVICELLGVPEADRLRFHTWVRRFADISGRPEDARAGRENLGRYIAGLVAAKRRAPADDVLSDLVHAREGEDRLNEDELVGLGYTLLGAGYDSSQGQLGNVVLTLLDRYPEVWQRLGQHPEEIPPAVEELLRMVNLNADDTSGLPRVALEDVVIGDVTVPAGDAVLLAFASANRDGSVFTDAERADFAREENPHLTFGHGIHHCLGAPLARMELTMALEELTRRFPEARLAVPEPGLRWRTGDVNHCLAALPVLLHGDAPVAGHG